MEDQTENILQLLEKIWLKYPGQRFGQMLASVLYEEIMNLDSNKIWFIFDIPDDHIISFLENCLENDLEITEEMDQKRMEVYKKLSENRNWKEKINKQIGVQNWVDDYLFKNKRYIYSEKHMPRKNDSAY